jgi:oligopeptide transport system substrate-binding protein
VRRVLDDPSYAENFNLIRQAQLAITYYNFATCIQPEENCPEAGTPDGVSPTANLAFRQALSHAINKEQFVELTFGGTGAVANSFVMPGLLGYQGDDFAGPYPFDTTAAAAAMQTALDEMGIEADPATAECDDACQATARVAKLGQISIGYNSDAGHLPRAVNLAEQWRTGLGFGEGQFELIGTDFPTFLQQRQAGTYMVSRNGWGADFPHPHNQLDGLFTCGGTNNDQQWCNEAFDEALREGARTTDQDAQDQIYRDAELMMLQEAPMIPLRFGEVVNLVSKNVSGMVTTSSDHQNPGDNFYENITVAAQ